MYTLQTYRLTKALSCWMPPFLTNCPAEVNGTDGETQASAAHRASRRLSTPSERCSSPTYVCVLMTSVLTPTFTSKTISSNLSFTFMRPYPLTPKHMRHFSDCSEIMHVCKDCLHKDHWRWLRLGTWVKMYCFVSQKSSWKAALLKCAHIRHLTKSNWSWSENEGIFRLFVFVFLFFAH